MSDFDNSIFVIIGGGSKLAQSFVPHLGSREVIVFSRSRIEKSQSGAVTCFHINDYSEVAAGLAELKSKRGNDIAFTVLFFGGVTDRSLSLNQSDEELLDIFNTNFFLPVRLTKQLVRDFITVPISFFYLGSARSNTGGSGILGYSSSKKALQAAVRSFADELSGFDKHFCVLDVGLTDAGLARGLEDKKIKRLLDRTHNKKMLSAKDLARTVLGAEFNSSINGSSVDLGGGLAR